MKVRFCNGGGFCPPNGRHIRDVVTTPPGGVRLRPMPLPHLVFLFFMNGRSG